MAATVTISESNGAGETVTNDITNSNMGSTDAANLVAASYPITAGQNSYEKYQRFRCSDAGGSSVLKNFKVWASAGPGTNITHLCNLRESSYGGASPYATPATATSTKAVYTMPVSEPTGPNLGYGGSLSGEMDITSGLPKYSDYLTMQLQSTVAATVGKTLTMNYQYDEVA